MGEFFEETYAAAAAAGVRGGIVMNPCPSSWWNLHPNLQSGQVLEKIHSKFFKRSQRSTIMALLILPGGEIL